MSQHFNPATTKKAPSLTERMVEFLENIGITLVTWPIIAFLGLGEGHICLSARKDSILYPCVGAVIIIITVVCVWTAVLQPIIVIPIGWALYAIVGWWFYFHIYEDWFDD